MEIQQPECPLLDDRLLLKSGQNSTRTAGVGPEASGCHDQHGLLRIATAPIKGMRGGSRSCLVSDSSGGLWVLKARHNGQHEKVVINELLGTHLARRIGLTVPDMSLMMLSSSCDWSEVMSRGRISKNYSETHFASAFVGARLPGKSYERLPLSLPHRLMNAPEVAGILALDVWIRNTDSRQAIFVRHKQSNLFRAYWIDFGNCFGGSSWCMSGGVRALLKDVSMYRSIHSIAQFLPWIDNINRLSLDDLLCLDQLIPDSWLSDRRDSLWNLANELMDNRRYLSSRIIAFVEANHNVFTNCKRNA